jgi:response regulator RpfG family c-di-GMP phosphodiesterase
VTYKNDTLDFAPEKELDTPLITQEPWKILIADDEKDVHTLSRLVLCNLEFEGRGVNILEAYTGKEAKKILLENPDCALVLVDVVMESDTEGLSLVQWIREILKNKLVRLILRSGQPGYVPEKELIINYDIDGYKEKSELTDQKLFTSVYTAIRSFRDLKRLENHKIALEQIIFSSTRIFSAKNLNEFLYYSVNHLTPLISSLRYEDLSAVALEVVDNKFEYIWGSGKYSRFSTFNLTEYESGFITSCYLEKEIMWVNNYTAIPIPVSDDKIFILLLHQNISFNSPDKYLLEIYIRNIEVGLEKILLSNEIEETQRELIYTLGDVVESRSEGTGSHVKRVGDMSYYLGKLYGLDESACELLKTSTPMHDVGKIAIPEAILNKPGALTKEERQLIETHAAKGYEILKGSKRTIIKSAAIIALQHHEKWDGTGYPMGLEGEHIHTFARITTVVDIFDALFHERVYKPSWAIADIFSYYQTESGKTFDPVLVDLFLDHIDDFAAISNGLIK